MIEPRVLPTGTITGIVFRDYNASGVQDAYEPGVGGVTVSAYGPNDVLIATTTTSSNPATLGQCSIAVPGTTIYEKVEFTTIPNGFQTGPSAATTTGTTNVQYTNTSGGAAVASLGINRPSQYTLANPNIAVADYVFGNQITGANATQPVLYSYPYNQTGTATTTPTPLATAAQVGSVFGLAYQASSNTVFASAFQKFAVGYGPNGPGAIYAVNGSGTGAVRLLVDLNTVFAAGTAGTDPHTNTNFSRDSTASFAGAGKIGLGGLAISEDGLTLYAMDLSNRRLYSIPIANPTATTITSYAIPIPTDASSNNDIRPFAVAVNDGQVYIGMVDTAQDTQRAADLKAYVYAFNPITATFAAAPALETSLNYTRGYADAYGLTGHWQPWTDTFNNQQQSATNLVTPGPFKGDNSGAFPEPELTGIAFDNGSMILGLRDRFGDQVGNGTNNPANTADTTLYRAIVAGDLLRASSNNAGGWTIESNAAATGPTGASITTAGAGNNQGPGGGRYYYQQSYSPNHNNTSLGAVLQLPGLPTVLTTAFDPTTALFAGGTRLDSNVTGANIQGYQLYANSGGPTFGKADGIGGVVALNPLAPLEIGGRVFNDPNFDGIKAAGEFGTIGATVNLYRGNTLVGTTTTTAGGIYTFNALNVVGGILPGVAYQIRLDHVADFAAGGVLAGTFLTRQGQDPRGLSGSKGSLTGTTPIINVTTGAAGTNDESNYFGFVQYGSLSGYVYADLSDDGVKQATEAGLANIPVTIFGGSLAAPVVILTDATGFYSLANLAPGTYTITANPPNGYLVGKDSIGTQGGTVTSATVLNAVLPAGTIGMDNNFGEVLPASIAGLVYLDANQSRSFGIGDTPIANATVTLTGTDDNGIAVNRVLVTGAAGTFAFTGLRPGTYSLAEAPPTGYIAGTDTPGTDGGTAGTRTITTVGINSGDTATGYNFGEFRPTVNGVVYLDANRNGVRDGAEVGIAGATIQLINAQGTVIATAATSATGAYSFPNVPTGTYTVVDTPPPGYGTDTLTTVATTLATAGTTTINYGLTTASLAGVVYNDINNNGVLDPTDLRLGAVQVTLTGGNLAAPLTTTTGLDGSYTFAGLLAGNYTITVGAPASLAPEAPTAGTAGGAPATAVGSSSINTINLPAGFVATGYQFPEAGAVLSGVAFVDANANRQLDGGETGVAGVLITLNDPATGAIVATVNTDTSGRYSFANLPTGTYNITETVPNGYGFDTSRTLTVYIPAGTSRTGQNFGLTLSTLAGNIYVDAPRAGAIQANDPPVGGVTVTLTGGNLATPRTTTTAADGSYSFANLLAGTYAVSIPTLAAYQPGTATPGSAGGAPASNTITTIVLGNAATGTSTTATGYNFGELGATISGVAFVDGNRNTTIEAGEAGVAGETILLLDAARSVVATTTTAANGTYSFTSLPAGDYTVNEIPATGYGTDTPLAVPVTAPAGGQVTANFGLTTVTLGGVVYVDAQNDGVLEAGDPLLAGVTIILTGTDSTGNAITQVTQTAADGTYQFAGLLDGTYTITQQIPGTYTVGRASAGIAGGTGGTDAVVGIVPDPGLVANGYNFGERGATLSGVAFTDLNGDGAYQRNEPSLAGVTVTLVNAAGTVVGTTLTLADGTYSFANLPSGIYNIIETPPTGYGSDTPTTLTMNIPRVGLPNQNFGSTLASLAGHVYLDLDNTGNYETSSPPIAGVTVTLTGGNLATPRTTTTAADGTYAFTGLLAGTYTVTETQPAAYNEGTTTAGSVNGTVGTDVVSAVALPAGVAAINYNFGETGTSITGVVFVDANADGIRQAGELSYAGVPITLRNGNGVVAGTTTTATDGTYSFDHLPAGNYTIQEGVPLGYGTSTPTTITNLLPLTGLTAQNFGLTTSSVSGTVFLDTNANRQLDAGDSGVAGQVVYILGTSNNGMPIRLQATTDAAGNYSFTGILSGLYSVVFLTQPTNYTIETTIPGSAQGTPILLGIANFFVGAVEPPVSANVTGYNFALVGSSISGTVFVDANADGIRQAGELGRPGVALTLLDSTGATVATTTTATDGSYSFANLPAGDYTVIETPPVGYGTDTPVRVPITLANGGAPVAAFGLTTSSLAGVVYVDTDRSGTLTAGDTRLAGVTVTLSGGNLATPLVTTTAADGTYGYTGLLAGTYTVTETQPTAYAEGTTTAGSAGGTVAGDVISAIALPAGTAATNYNFGEVGTAIAGTVFVDANGNGTRQAGELGQAGVTLTLLNAAGATVGTTTTAADGSYSFANLPAGNYTVVETPPAGYGTDTPVRLPVTLVAGVAPVAAFGLTTSSLAGTVYLDNDRSGTLTAGDTRLAGVTVTLSGGNLATPLVTTTAADGTYGYTGLLAGTYTAVETQPTAYAEGTTTAGSAGGTVIADVISAIALPAGTAATNYNFGEVGTAITGTVFVDANGNGTRQTGELGQAGVALTLLNAAGATVGTTTTAADGSYSFANLPAGTYTVVETPPVGYGTDTPVRVPVTLVAGVAPVAAFGLTTSSLAGVVYVDTDRSGTLTAGDTRLAGVTVTLSGGNLATPLVTTTAADGTYGYTGLLAGTYTVTETQPTAYAEGTTTAGSAGGTVAGDVISAIALPAGTAATNYNFGEVGTAIAGTVFVDANGNGTRQAGELGQAGVTLTLLDAAGATIATTTSGADGSYSFPGVPAGTYTVVETPPVGYGTDTPVRVPVTLTAGGALPTNFGLTTSSLAGVVYIDTDRSGTLTAGDTRLAGVTVTLSGGNLATPLVTTTAADGTYGYTGLLAGTYTAVETQPTAYAEGTTTAGSAGGTVAGDVISAIALPAGTAATNYNFGEVGTAITGTVFVDANNDGTRQATEPGQAGVTLTLLDAAGATIATTTSGADGSYSFPGVPAGTYTVVETPPVGYGTDTPVRVPVTLTAGGAVPTNFGLTTSSLAGTVYLDSDRSGGLTAGDARLAGVTVTLTGGTLAAPLTTITAADGTYGFTGLLAGTYTVTETQPTAYAEGTTTAGSAGGAVATDVISAIALPAGTAATNYNFGEVDTAITGTVFVDANNDGTRQAAELGQPGVTLTLLDAAGVPIASTITQADGSYSFPGVPAGTYTVVETPPIGYGTDTPVRLPVTVAAGAAPVASFGLTTSSLGGTVYLDVDRGGSLTAGDPGLAGVTVTLSGGNLATPLVTTTAADGTYLFTGLLTGTYTVIETQPAAYAGGTTTAGSAGGTVAGDVISAIALPAGTAATNYNFGEVGTAIAGTVFVDANNDGTRQATEPGQAGVTLTLLDAAGATIATTTSGADGSYSFPGVPAGTYTVVETPPVGYGTDTPVRVPVTLTAGGALPTNFGLTTSSLAGTVYVDIDQSGTLTAGDARLAGVTVTLTGGTLAAPLTTITAADGTYGFTGLLAGTYTAVETQPTAYAEGTTTAGSAGGTVLADVISAIALPAGTAATNYNFGEVGTAIAGTVFVDANNDGTRQATEPGQAGVTLTLLDAAGATIATTTSGADGSYSFPGVPAGTYTVVETPPAGYGTGTPVQVPVTLTAGGAVPTTFALTTSSLAGTVYVDIDRSGTLTAGDTPLAGVTVTLSGGNLATPRTATTAADGTYLFTGLVAGTYTVIETQPTAYAEGATTAGSAGGTVQTDVISAIALPAGTAAVNYNFGEVGTTITGTVFVDANGNGTRQTGEVGQAGVTISLLDAAGATIATTITQEDGSYSFPGVPAGTYTVVETPPAGYGTDTPVQLPVTVVAGISPTAGFGLTTSSLTGSVYLDVDRSGTLTAGDTPLAGVTVTLTGGDLAAPLTTTTAADGTYSFSGLLAGTYTVTETQPATYGESATTAGSAGGTVAIDSVTAIALPVGTAATNYNFGEQSTAITGTVFVDANGDGTRQPGEAGQPGVTLTLLDAAGATIATTTTAADGTYSFPGLPAGAYTVVETPPVGYGTGTPVRVPVVLTPTGAAPTNFALTTTSLAGHVYVDGNDNGQLNAGETGLGGVTVILTGTDAAGQTVNRTTTTAADGSYLFTGLLAGTYNLVETTPAGYLLGTNAAGSLGGTVAADRVTNITLGANAAGVAYNFAELLPAAVTGTVYFDANNSGTLDTGDGPIAGVTITLTGTDDRGNPVQLTTATGIYGTYAFNGLRPGTYSLTESAPAGYAPGKSSAGSTGGTGATRTITGLTLTQGAGSTTNNFAELQAILAGTVLNDGLPVAGASVVVTDPAGNILGTTTTASDGTYQVPSLPAGVVTVTATIPVVGSPPIVQSAAVTMTGGATTIQNFAAANATGSLAGVVYADTNNNGTRDPGELGLAGVVVTLTGTSAAGNPINLTTTTSADGSYTFTGLPIGTYTLTETAPLGDFAGKESLGTIGGLAGSRTFSGINIGSGSTGTGYNFAELLPTSLSGSVYLDANRNGKKDGNEFGVAHVPIVLTGYDDLGHAVVESLMTNDDGSYSFTGLRPGVYAVTETQPSAFLGGKANVGTVGGTICCDTQITGVPLAAGAAGSSYNFGLTPKPGCKLDTAQYQAFLRMGPSPITTIGTARASILANLKRTIPQISYYVPTLAQRMASGTTTHNQARAAHATKAKAAHPVKATVSSRHVAPKGPLARAHR